MRLRGRRIDLLLAGLGALCAALPALGQGLEIETEPVVSNLDRPLGIVAPPDGSGRLFLVEQSGKILIRADGEVLSQPFLDLTSEISCCGERGLLGLGFHPDYAANGFFFVAYTEVELNGATPPVNDLLVSRFSVSADPDVAQPGSELVLLDLFQPYGNHNGGHLAFGPDGYLYIATGDGGSGGDPGNRAQDLDTLLGKILRIDVDSTEPGRNYAIPASNPFTSDPGGCTDSCPQGSCGSTCDEIWAYGLRNPWRFSFDSDTGDLYIGDVGQDDWEEINYRPASSSGGENYGWKIMEGTHCYPPDPSESCISPADHVGPVLEYDHDSGCSVTGGFVYRGSEHPQLDGVYLYADFCNGRIWGTVPRCDGGWESRLLVDTPFSISSFGANGDGELFVADLADNTGQIHALGLTDLSGGPALELLPSPVDFGSPPSSSLEVLVRNANLGPEALKIDDLALASGTDFGLDLSGGSSPCLVPTPCLAPGESCTVELTFSGGASAWFLDTLLVPGNSQMVAAGVGACTAPDDLVVANTEVDAAVETFDGCLSVTAGPAFTVTATGKAILRGGDRVILDSDSTIRGELEIHAGLP